MKCPNCGKEGARFKDKKKLLANKGKSQRFREFGRDSNLAKCNKLNLGCGGVKKKGYINVDYNDIFEPDFNIDLDKFPYPFRGNYFDVVEAMYILEHLYNPFKVMKEIHRISKKGAEVIIKVSHFSRGFTHAEHKRSFDVGFPLYFNKNFKEGYLGYEFELIEMKLVWFSQPCLKKKVLSKTVYFISNIVGKLLDFLANVNPYFCSRVWCFLVGGFEEISFRFKVRKK